VTEQPAPPAPQPSPTRPSKPQLSKTQPSQKRTLLGLASLSGTIWVAAGSAILGASGYAFLVLTKSTLSVSDYAALVAFYPLVAFVGPALFIPVEQEATRLVSRAHALGHGTRDVLIQLAQVSAGLSAVATVLLVAAGPFLVSRIFNGHVGLLVALIASVLGYGGACLIRGAFAGERRLREYAICVGVDGLTRLVPCVALVVAGVSAQLPYGLALGLGSVAALAVGLVWFRPGSAGPRMPWRDLLVGTGWLVAAWGASFALANVAPVVVKALLPLEPERTSMFTVAFVVARVPVFVLLSLQAILLPALSRAAATRDLPGLRRGIRQAMIVVGGLGAVSLATTAPLCLWLVAIMFPGARAALSWWVLTLLAVGTILAMIVQVLQPALLAVAGHRLVAAAWVAGVAVFAASFALPLDAVLAATVAQLMAGVTTTTVMGIALARHLRTAGQVPLEVPA
jgi:O-antigen/teichoic acid export membrane protein